MDLVSVLLGLVLSVAIASGMILLYIHWDVRQGKKKKSNGGKVEV